MNIITATEIKALRDCIKILEDVRDATVSIGARDRLHKKITSLYRLKHKAALVRFNSLQGSILPP